MSTFPAYRPIAEFVKGRLKTNSEGVSPTQKVAWLRVAASAEPGLVLYSNPSQSTFHTGSDDMHQTAYGRGDFGGSVGETWGGEPVNTDSTPGRGLRPRPLIDSVTLKNGAGGMTRTCEFNINCYTLEQMEIVAQHFQEPGYTCMIEFGWNVEESITQLTSLDTNSVAALNDYEKVINKHKDSDGTYECFFGMITGGSISSNGEVFVVSVKCTGLGQMPSTLQSQKSFTKKEKEAAEEAATSQKYGPNEIDDDALSTGQKLFRLMFNDLPSSRLTPEVKKLEGELGLEENFINFDPETKDSLQDETTNTKVNTDSGQRATIPEGVSCVGDERFIKFGTLKKIIDTAQFIDLEKGFKLGSENYPLIVNTKDTICSAFDEIFSTSKSTLIVPNSNTPDFGFFDFLEGDKPTEKTNTDCSAKTESGETAFEFPYRQPLADSHCTTCGGAAAWNAPGDRWGYLDDLFINFDFAVEVLERPNMTYQDVLYDMLNGMSEAVNSLWKFEILERPNKDTCKLELQVVDLNFTSDGKVPASIFKHAGADSFFISSDLSIDIPGEMMNSIVSDRLAGVDTQEDVHPTRKRGGIYSDKRDLVLEEMNKKDAVVEDSKPPGQPKEDSEELAAALYDSFLGKIGSYPKIKSGKIGLDGGAYEKYVQGRTASTLVESLQFPVFEDKALFAQKMAPSFGDQDKMSNPSGVPLPITYTFTVHGVSGIVHGDTFNVDGIPEKYKNGGFFQVMDVTHNLAGSTWTTTIKGDFRVND